jgi:hypothetical protein
MLPKFSIRQLLWGTLVFAFLAIGIAAAYRGNLVAYGLVLAPALMVVPLLTLAIVYWIGAFISALLFKPIHSTEPSSVSSGISFGVASPAPTPATERPVE